MRTDSYDSFAVRTLPLGDLTTNCYLIWDTKTLECLIIDPADSGDFITEQITDLQLKPQAIILTHGHFDHVLGVLEVKLNFDVPVLLHPKDGFLLERAQSSALHWLKRQVDPVPPADKPLTDHQNITFSTNSLTVMETPGHTPGSVCLMNDDIIFTGDTLFVDGVGRTDFKYANAMTLAASLRKIKNLAKDRVLYAGHGEVGTVHNNTVQ